MGISTPFSAAASTRIMPGGAAASRPFSEKATVSGWAWGSANGHLAHRLGSRRPVLDRANEVLAEAADGADHRQHAGVGERAQHAALHAAAYRLDERQVLQAP